MPIFTDLRQKSGQLTLSDREKKVGLIMPSHMYTYRENLMKIDPVHFRDITKGTVNNKIKVTSAVYPFGVN